MITRAQALRVTHRNAWLLCCAVAPFAYTAVVVTWDRRGELLDRIIRIVDVRRD